MKQDFLLAKQELGRIGIKRIATDFYSEPKRKGSCYFVKSPAAHDKTASLALYPNSNRFTNFANGGISGDCIYRTAIEKRLYEPFSDLWTYCMEEVQKIDYKLDILCAAGYKEYPPLKAHSENLPSDRFQWLLDCLVILQESGTFEAIKEELKEIKTQRDYELIRQPGQLGGVILNGSEQEIKFPNLICMADVKEKVAEWLVPGYVAKACINMMAGDGGSGKTTGWCGIAAAVSAGKKVFFDTVPEEFAACEPQKVLFFSSEDSIEHTLRAGLRKAGANLNNILSVSLQDEFFGEITFNSPILEKLIEEVRPALVIFDPIQSFIPPEMQMGQRNAMRNCLNPLIGWGEKYGCTFLIIVHTNKRQGVFERNRVADIWDIARSVLIVGQTQDGKRYLSHEKSNYGELEATAIFDIEDGVAVFEEYSGRKGEDFVQERDFDVRQAPQRQDAERFIFEFLKNGKKPTAELDEAAKAAGISKSTLGRTSFSHTIYERMAVSE